jgi:hypothetical protein
VDRRSVQRWIARYRRQANIAALRHQPGQGRPRRWDQALGARLELALSQRPAAFGYAATGWTVPLLQQWLADDRAGPRLSAATRGASGAGADLRRKGRGRPAMAWSKPHRISLVRVSAVSSCRIAHRLSNS